MLLPAAIAALIEKAGSYVGVPLPIDSHVIQAASYNGNRELVLTFSTGTYRYANVPVGVVAGLLAASSPTTHFARHIRDSYASSRE